MAFEFSTAVTPESFAGLVKRPATDPAVVAAVEEAIELLTDATADAFRTIPAKTCDDLVVRVARGLLDASRSQYGAAQTTQVQGETVVRAPRDPLGPVALLLSRYVIGLA